MFKKLLKIITVIIFIIIALIVLLVACSDSDTSSVDSDEKIESKGELDEKDYDKLYTNPEKYKGYEVTLTGQVFSEPEKDDEGVYFQMFGDPENSEKNTMVSIKDASLKIKSDQYVKVVGTVVDEYEGENAFGGSVVAAAVRAESVEVVDYITATSPTKKTIELNKEINQQGLVVTLQKVELADNQTRVFVKINNTTDEGASFYSSNTKLIVNNKQLEDEYYDSEETGLPELQSDLLPQVETEGVIFYPAVDQTVDSIKLNIDASTENYDVDFSPYVFEIPLK